MEKVISLRQQIIGMDINQKIVLPLTVKSYATARTYASDLGSILKRKITVNRNYDEQTLTITRVL